MQYHFSIPPPIAGNPLERYARFAWCMVVAGLCFAGAAVYLVLEHLITWGSL